MAKRNIRAEQLADRILAGLRPSLVRALSQELAGLEPNPVGEVELTDEDVDQAEKLVERWGRKRSV